MLPDAPITIHAETSLYGSAQDEFLQNENDLSVAELIPRILAERKSFLNISEESLAAEIRNKTSDIDVEGVTPNSEEQTSDSVESEETTVEKFAKNKAELLSYIGSALNETSLSLDFVSLLMSAEKPNITKSTISPHLSKNAPLGSLSSDRLSFPGGTSGGGNSESGGGSGQAHTSEKEKLANVGLGWKYQALKNITELFKDAADQLRGQVNVEKNYWQKISQVLAHDEVLFKLRDPATNARSIGVRYGYGDSGSTYHDKGLAVLRKNNETGDITFNPITSGISSGETKKIGLSYKFTRVRILSKIDHDFILTGQSVFQKSEIKSIGEDTVIGDIEKARFFLFEDDLFYHLIREAKFLISYNVTIIADKIIVDLADQIIELESVYYDEENEHELTNLYQNTNDKSLKHNAKAQDILKFLKLMLCCFYQYRLKLKHKMPTSFTKWKQANSHPLLLRPLVGHSRHQMNFSKMKTLVQKLCRDLNSTAMTSDIQEKMYANLKTENVENPFEKAIQRPTSTITVILEKLATKSHIKAEIEVTTSEVFVDLVIKLTVSRYKCKSDLEENLDGVTVLDLEFTELDDVGESLEWTLLNFLEGSGSA